MVTILSELGAFDGVAGEAAGDDLWLPSGEATRATGWTLKPEGFCRDNVCVPAPPGDADAYVRGDSVNVAAFWRRMDRPVLHDADGGTWVLGDAAAERAEQLASLRAPDFTLPDLSGRMHSLSDYRGKKVFLSTWASW